MRFFRAALKELVGLFVTNWTETAVTVAILALAFIAAHFVSTFVIGIALVLLLATQLIYSTTNDARKRRAPKKAT